MAPELVALRFRPLDGAVTQIDARAQEIENAEKYGRKSEDGKKATNSSNVRMRTI